MHKIEYVLLKMSQKIIWDFKMDLLIPTRRGNLVLINNNKKKKRKKEEKRTCHLMDFAVTADH